MNFSRVLLALFFVVAGVNHFVSSKIYLSIMPPYLPWPAQLVALSGVAEIAGGVGVLFSQTRKLAGWCLLALLIAVFPANIQAIPTGMVIAGHALPNWLLWLRLPLQVVLLVWVYRVCLRPTVRV